MNWREALGIGRVLRLGLLALGCIGYGAYRGVLTLRDVAGGKFAGRAEQLQADLGAAGLMVLLGIGFFIWLFGAMRKAEAAQRLASQRRAAGLCVACGTKLFPQARFCGDCGAAISAAAAGSVAANSQ